MTRRIAKIVEIVDPDRDERDGNRRNRIIGINQVVWDPLTNTLYVESDELLEQHERYVLIVTRGLRDPDGRSVWVRNSHPHRDRYA